MQITTTMRTPVGWATAGTTGDVYVCHGQSGEWKLLGVHIIPDTTAGADATNYASLAITQGATSIGTAMTTASVALTAGTLRSWTMTENSSRVFGSTDLIKVAKTIAGTGAAVVGTIVAAYEKFQGDGLIA